MTFEQRLAFSAKCVQDRLEAILPQNDGRDVPPRLLAAMRHAVLGQGKRFRPYLVFETARLFGIAPGAAVDAAAAIECVHCYSLVHDDLPAMDNDELRRGQPTVWKAYDEWTAILAGDALLTLAFELLAGEASHPDPAVRLALVGSLARAAGPRGMVGGQMIDLEADKLGTPTVATPAHVRRLQAMKTGALIACAVEMGALVGGADARQRALLERYASALGLAFQLSDDLLDAEGSAAVVGKAVAKDAAAGKATLIGLLGIDEARRELTRSIDEALDALSPFGPAATPLADAARYMAQRQH